MTVPIDELITPVTADEANETALSTVESVGVPIRSWKNGGAGKLIVRAWSALFAALTNVIAALAAAGFLDLSSGKWLTALALYVYNVPRVTATFATGKLTLTNTGGGSFTKVAREVRFVNPTTKKAYENAAGFTLGPLATLEVDIVAVEVGSGSSAPPDSITNIETTMLGVTCTNVGAIAGNDDETDASLRQACRDVLGARSVFGPRSAYAYWSKRAKRNDGSTVDVNRVTVTNASSIGVVKAWLASPSGGAIASDVEAVRAAFEINVRPDTVTAIAVAATTVAVPLTGITIWARKEYGADATAIGTAATNALVALAREYPIGGLRKPPVDAGYLYADKIVATIIGSHPAIYDVDGVGADVPIPTGAVPIITSSLSVNLVAGVQ